jgi:hypothetical protein
LGERQPFELNWAPDDCDLPVVLELRKSGHVRRRRFFERYLTDRDTLSAAAAPSATPPEVARPVATIYAVFDPARLAQDIRGPQQRQDDMPTHGFERRAQQARLNDKAVLGQLV